MKRALIGALALTLLVPTGASAQDEPQVICTRMAVNDDHILSDSPAFRGEPQDGACDVVVYLPLVLGDSLLMGSLIKAAEDAQAAEYYAGLSCSDLDKAVDNDDDWELAYDEHAGRCATCLALQMNALLPEDSHIGRRARLEYAARCEGGGDG